METTTTIPIAHRRRSRNVAVTVTGRPWFTITGRDRAADEVVKIACQATDGLEAVRSARQVLLSRGSDLIVHNTDAGVLAGAQVCS